MRRIDTYTAVRGRNWLVGRQLLPVLSRWGGDITGVVLDLGCGESPFRYLFPRAKEYIRMDRIAVDPDVVLADITKIPLELDSADVVLLFQVLGDIPDLEPFLQEIRRVLRSGGKLIVSESLWYPEHDLPHDYYRIMPSGLEHLAGKCGFDCQEIIRIGGSFSRIAQYWNTFAMGYIRNLPLIGLLAPLGIAAANVIAYPADRLAPHPRMATDYVALLSKAGQ